MSYNEFLRVQVEQCVSLCIAFREAAIRQGDTETAARLLEQIRLLESG